MIAATTWPRVLLDTAVFVYAVGVAHPYRDPCRAIVTALGGEGRRRGQRRTRPEFLHQRARRTGDHWWSLTQRRD